jgi:hypothetical protein
LLKTVKDIQAGQSPRGGAYSQPRGPGLTPEMCNC